MRKVIGLVISLVMVLNLCVACGGGEKEAAVTVKATEAPQTEKAVETTKAETEKEAETTKETAAPAPAAEAGLNAGEVISLENADVQITKIDKSGSELVLEIAVKNTGNKIMDVVPGAFWIENLNKKEDEKHYMWDVSGTGNEILSEIKLVPGGMMVSEVAFKSPLEESNILLIAKELTLFDKEYVRVDLNTEVSPLALKATPDASLIDGGKEVAIGEMSVPAEGVAEATVNGFTLLDGSEKYPPSEGKVNGKVEYTIKNIGDKKVNPGFLKIGVYDYATGQIKQQGKFPILDGEIWIYKVEVGETNDFFMCYELTKDGKYAVVFSAPFKTDFTIVPLN